MTYAQPRAANSPSLDLTQTSVLLVDPDHYSVDMLSGMLRGFRIKEQMSAESGEAARNCLEGRQFDMVIVEAVLPDMAGADLARWMRRQAGTAIRHVPIIILMGHTVLENIELARNSGANLIVRKPVVPGALFDRIGWIARTERAFVETGSYIGPDRRFKLLGPPEGVGRRRTDLPAELGAASEPNLAQCEIDTLLKPVKVRLD
jgi:DNA-binding response OmpR family regulator